MPTTSLRRRRPRRSEACGCERQPQLSRNFWQGRDGHCPRPRPGQPDRRPHPLQSGFCLADVIPQQTVVEAGLGTGVHEVYSATLGRMARFDRGALSDFTRYVGGCVRVLEERGADVPPLRLRISSDVPVGAGLSSSAALEVATVRALDALLGLDLEPEEVAMLAHKAEVDYAGVACGIMDQIACSLAEPDLMLFLDTMAMERR